MLNSSVLLQAKSLHIIITTSELLSRNFPGGPEGRINTVRCVSGWPQVIRPTSDAVLLDTVTALSLLAVTCTKHTTSVNFTRTKRQERARGTCLWALLCRRAVIAGLGFQSLRPCPQQPRFCCLVFSFPPPPLDPQSHEWEKSLCSQSERADFITQRT